MRCLSCKATWPIGLRFVSRCIQESDRRLVLFPFPITLPRCLNNKSLHTRMPLQPCEIAEPRDTFVKEVLYQYLLNKILVKRLFGLVKIFQAIFASRALLNVWTSRKASLPRLLGWVRESQDFQQFFFLSILWIPSECGEYWLHLFA